MIRVKRRSLRLLGFVGCAMPAIALVLTAAYLLSRTRGFTGLW